jgi:hypothetical protein
MYFRICVHGPSFRSLVRGCSAIPKAEAETQRVKKVIRDFCAKQDSLLAITVS